MKIEIAERGRMTQSGSSLLRLIQNQDMPLLDLLVREAVQNSLDAARVEMPFVNVDISIKQFLPKDLNKYLEGITDKLNERYPSNQGKRKSIVVRDSNTVGLTGPVKDDEVKGQDFGNCLKLIYEICKPQSNAGAGGSWGIGKTIYFRVGIGLVLYYSRIKVNGRFKSRLAACLVENEKKNDSLIPSYLGCKRGIAWWGELIGQNKTAPIEKEYEIEKILSVFGLSSYRGDETGTTVIIPYIDEKALLQEVYAKNEEQDPEHKPYWVEDVADYLKVAFQRWYSPRIMNKQFLGPYLNPSVNSDRILISKFMSFFKVVRELYVFATTGGLPEDSIVDKKDLVCNDIRTNKVFLKSSSAGKFVYIKLGQDRLKMLAPDNEKSPYQQINNRFFSMDGNTPIIMYTRKLGMIVDYDFEGAWTHRMPRSMNTEYIIGLFVANSENRLKDIRSEDGKNLLLEEYIRQTEKADHASWTDINISGTNPRVIYKVQTNIIKIISQNFKDKTQDEVRKNNIGLSHFLANILLPSTGFGKEASWEAKERGEGSGRGSGTSKKRSSISIIGQPEFTGNDVSIRFELNMSQKDVVINLLVVTDFKKIGSEEWESDNSIGQAFPLHFSEILIFEKKEKTRNAQWHFIKSDEEDSSIEVSYGQSSRFKTKSFVTVTCNEACCLRGMMIFSSSEKDIQGTVEISEGKR